MDYKEMMEYVQQEINNSDRIERYPFRDRYSHTLRVLKWAERIHKEEGGDLEIVKIACLFHDVGWDKDINHSYVSKEIAEKYLLGHGYNEEKLDLVLEAVENHNFRNNENEVSLESYIVMDADMLDEVGAMSIIWDSMASMLTENKSYYDVYERIKYYFNRMNHPERLKTKTGKRYYKERLRVIAQFIDELEFELF